MRGIISLKYIVPSHISQPSPWPASLCEDISSLESTLKILGNKLVFQDADAETDADGHGEAGLTPDERDGLRRILAQTAQILADLRKRVPATRLPRGLYRLRWSSGEVQAVRSRITATTSALAAFNSSVIVSRVQFAARTERSQRQILSTLREILLAMKGDAGYHADGAPFAGPTTTTTLVADASGKGEKTLNKGRDKDGEFWRGLVEEMRKHGVTGVQLDDKGQVILQSAAPGTAPGTAPVTTSVSTLEMDEMPTVEVLSAVYGPRVITSLMRRMVDSHASTSHPTMRFTATNEIFGGDPLHGHHKAFCMAWRKRIVRGNKVLYSRPLRISAKENDVVAIHLDAQLEYPDHDGSDEESHAAEEGTTRIVMACWNEIIVTQRVASLVAAGHSVIKATSAAQLVAADPAPGYTKTLFVCWTYRRGGRGAGVAATTEQYETATALEGAELEIPPCLRILCANWGGLDITALVQGMTTRRQTLVLDSDRVMYFAAPDPWVNEYKTIAVVYRYGGGGGMRLLVVGEREGVVEVTPYNARQRAGREYAVGGKGGRGREHVGTMVGRCEVLAVVWGLQPVPLDRAGLGEALREGRVPCGNEFFGVDGWEGVHKTCQVFVRDEGGLVRCCVGREGNVLELTHLQSNSRDNL